MAIRIETDAEPIPGYRLIERLGSGGFGEVWKAEAPGGLFKAIKFVQRSTSKDSEALSIIGGSVPDRSRADQEWKSLMRVKSVRHPFILLLDRFENIDNCLVIVMELADRTLGDRFKECRSQGLPGVPRDELLRYMAEAAEVLDLMNAQYQLQHLDIKPQNLFLVHQHVKVADFGLVKDTTNGKDLMTITGGVTPVYAAPETFDGQFSRQSDQYSLAIVYQEMLTGLRPFNGTTMKQLVLQHLQNAHDLTPAPVHDRPILARALAKNPEDRFVTCVDFVQALAKATLKFGPGDGGQAPAAGTGPGQPYTAHNTVLSRGSAGPVKPAEPNFSVEQAFLTDVGKPAPPPRSVPLPASEPLGKSSRTPNVRPRRKPKEQRPSTHDLPGIVQPALIVGLGQLGIETLVQLKQQVTAELGSANALPKVRLLGFDTDPEGVQRAIHSDGRSSMTAQELLLTRLQRPSQYLHTRDGKLPTDHWLNSRFLHRIPREQNGAGMRALGRLAFVDSYRVIAKRLESELHTLCSQDTPYAHTPYADLGLRTVCPRVYVVTSLTGNTGGGMFLDFAYLLRKLLNEQGHEDAEIVGLFYLPAAKREAAYWTPVANAYAALVELQHFSQREAIFSALYETGASMSKGERVVASGPAFQRCTLICLPETKGKPSPGENAPVVARMGAYLYRDLATVLGQAFDEQRLGMIQQADAPAEEPLLHSVGMFRIHWPRHALLEQASRRLCARLLAHWMNKDATPLADTLRQWTHERWEALGMRPENLIERFQELSAQSLNKTPELVLGEILAPVQKALGNTGDAKAAASLRLGSVVEGMERLERAIGLSEESRAAKGIHVEPALMENTLDQIAVAVADECERRLAQLAVQLLEDPNYRLAGAEESLRQFCGIVDQSLQSQEVLAKELNDRATQLYQRIQLLVEVPLQTPPHSSSQKSTNLARRSNPKAATPSSADLFELIRTYAKTRYHGLVLTYLNRLYLSLRGHLSDQIREVGFCRQRLGELLGLVQPPETPPKAGGGADERVLFPAGCVDLNDAVEQLSGSITIDDLLDFDATVQGWIEEHCEALLQICMGSSTTVKNVAAGILQEADAFLSTRLQGNSVAEMYLSRKRSEHEEDAIPGLVLDDLQRCLDDATPEIGRIAQHSEIAIVSLPNDENGKELQQLLHEHHREVKTLLSDRQDEMLFYHEIIRVQWKHLEQLGPIAREVYQNRCAADPSSLHTRGDVFEWQIINATSS